MGMDLRRNVDSQKRHPWAMTLACPSISATDAPPRTNDVLFSGRTDATMGGSPIMMRSADELSPWVRAWLAWSAGCALATGALSLPGWLNGWGWGFCLALSLVGGTAVGWIRWQRPTIRWHRLRRGLPAAFVLTLALAALGACVFPPTNIDTLWYRLPRVIQWLQAGRWHWLDTERWRLNSIAFGLELHWLPWAAWGLPDRVLALPNLVSFALLPGLLFRVFRQAGATGRVARMAMWVVASGWCYVAQAGSTASDAFAAVYFLAAVDAALAFTRSHRPGTLAWSVLAAALLTNTKQTNLPLLLPWVVALAPAHAAIRTCLHQSPFRTGLLLIAAFLASTGPLIVANIVHTGGWTGTPAWANERWRPAHPLFALAIQLPFLLLQNLQPPITPGTEAWNAWMTTWTSGPIAPWFQGFDLPGRLFAQIGEHCVGFGLAPTLWVFALWVAARRCRASTGANPNRRLGFRLGLATGLAAAVLLTRIGFLELARYFAAYYPLLVLPALLHRGADSLARRRPWHLASLGVVIAGVAFVATVRHRPIACPPSLLQAGPLGRIGAIHRLGEALEFQTGFGRQLGSFEKLLPPGEPLGWAHDSPGEAEFAWPPDRRRIQLLPPQSPEALRQAGLRWVVTSAITETNAPAALERWAAERGGRVRAMAPFVFRFGVPAVPYALVELPTPNAADTTKISRSTTGNPSP